MAAIAARMEVDPNTVRRWYKTRGFLMMRRRHKTNMWHDVWYTNDALIHAWELDQCRRQAHDAGVTAKR